MKLYKPSIALVIALGCLTGLVAQANVSRDVKEGMNAPTVMQRDQGVLFHVKNPLDRMVKFKVPELGIDCELPRQAQNTFYVDMSRMPTPEATFTFESWDGKVEATGKLANGFVYYSPTSLDHIIHYDTSYTYDEKPAPKYRDRH